jgi:hypothetical protein
MKYSPKLFSFKIACLSMLLLVLLVPASLAMAQSGTRVYLQPVEPTAGLLTVDVMVDNATDLYGLEIHLKYDPAVLEIQDSKIDQEGVQVESGALLPVNQGFVVANQANQAAGMILYALTLLNPAPAVTGSGPVARLSFKLLQNTPTTLTIEQATLVAVNLQTIPAETVPLTIGDAAQTAQAGSSTPAPAGGTSSFPWWIVAAVVLLLGILAIGAFVVFGGFIKKAQPKVAIPSQKASRQSEQGSGRRPSAFKESALPKPPQSRQ